ncbi:hypothetical protein NDU88_009022 [Pleurodeles waltl]|uniref:Uncharacterized protein n=1 Tax=Pleurodeles waltl TaxID=8319 RepID=A0AAV7RZA4_PLEWA|nr:hypothetical protein NDU88_009022 [Pleurodeles waltl]
MSLSGRPGANPPPVPRRRVDKVQKPRPKSARSRAPPQPAGPGLVRAPMSYALPPGCAQGRASSSGAPGRTEDAAGSSATTPQAAPATEAARSVGRVIAPRGKRGGRTVPSFSHCFSAVARVSPPPGPRQIPRQGRHYSRPYMQVIRRWSLRPTAWPGTPPS